jgi:hypothetical protein
MNNRESLVSRSPLRALEASMKASLGKGQLGIVMARHGAGKTPFLVGVALDALIQGAKVLHVSLDMKAEHIRDFYDLIFGELAKAAKLEHEADLHLSMERNRRIHAYLRGSFQLDKLASAMEFMSEHASFSPDLLVVDEYDFSQGSNEEVQGLLKLAAKTDAQLWMTAVRHRDEPVTDDDGIPAPVADYKQYAEIVLDLQTGPDGVKISLLKPKRSVEEKLLPVVLDPTTMLMHEATKD